MKRIAVEETYPCIIFIDDFPIETSIYREFLIATILRACSETISNCPRCAAARRANLALVDVRNFRP